MPEAATLAPPPPQTEERQLGIVSRELAIRAESFNEEARTVDVVFTTGARRTMFSWSRWEYVDEELDTAESAVRLERINAGGPVLNSHRSGNLADQIGVVVDGSARMEGGLGVATIRLSAREDLAGIVQDIRDGIIRNISVGYIVHQYEVTERAGERPLYRAVSWEPAEISFVPIPADAGAGTRSAETPEQGGAFPCIISRAATPAPALQEVRMTTPNELPAGQEAPAVTAPVAAAAPAGVSAATVRQLARNAQLPADQVLELIERHETAPFTNEAILAEIGQRWAGQASAAAPQTGGARVTVDEREKVRAALEGAISHRAGVRGVDLQATGASEFRSLSLVEMGREIARRNGDTAIVRADASTVAGYMLRAGSHSTSDFPLLLANVAGKSLRQAYDAAPRAFADIVRTIEVPDFKPQSLVALGDAPVLEEISETGQIKDGTIGEAAESVALRTYAKKITVSRRMIVNDDLMAFARIPEMFGRRAAELEGDLVFTNILVGNPNLASGGALFQTGAARGSNLASSGSAINVASLGAGRAVMRKQTGINGARINIAPRFLVVGPDKETEADQINAAILANVTTNANVFMGRLEVRVDPRITGNLWFLVADPAAVDTIVLAYLSGRAGPVVEETVEFDTDGAKIRCLFDVAASAVDFRGMYRNPGA
jgi:phage major head subunit gpT-like protein